MRSCRFRAAILLAAIIACAALPTRTWAMSLSFSWGPTKACFDRNSPPIRLKGVPRGTPFRRIGGELRSKQAFVGPHEKLSDMAHVRVGRAAQAMIAAKRMAALNRQDRMGMTSRHAIRPLR